MKKFHADEKSDILEERYHGPGPVVASAGYMALSHLAATIVTAVAFGLVGRLATGPTIAVKEAFTKFGAAHAESPNLIKKAAGVVVGGIPKVADYFATKVAGAAKKVSRGRIGHVDETTDKAAAAMFAGGIGGATGWIGSTIWGVMKGGHEGNVGKHQFNRAKAEIKDLRERNDALEKKQAEITPQKDSPEQPIHADSNEIKPAAHTHHETPEHAHAHTEHHEKPAHSIHAHGEHAPEHHGKIHAHQQHEHAAHSHA